ncbi:DUF1697 domain-containing protein [Nocardioides sp. TF02-7]|uniref:DUF1697 domain-containing protein n=1 Tax=Nocardioides sp. TF02-7 TaxID=2917724 RepID=UPI001F05C111|nr:DUF1697 domain-containing protein [Nocardioides sp. TF02-7]UMG94848.1 DUF1697 domain-containing protein [Nocardioides sp. TF02-7]
MRKFAKGDIAAATEAAGFTDVATHINTGNVRLTTAMRSRARIESALEAAYAERAGFDVPTIVFDQSELRQVAAEAEELNAARPDLERHYLFLLKTEPAADRVAALLAKEQAADTVVVRGRVAHVLLGPGYQQGTVDPAGVEKALGVVATNRNYNVVTTLARKWC